MKKLVVLFCILFALRVPVHASDITFAQSAFSSNDREDDEDEAESLFVYLLAFCFIGLGVCYYWMNTVHFFDYPYQNEEVDPSEGSYLIRGTRSGSLLYSDPGYNSSRYSIDSSIVYLHGFGLGNESRFEGLLFPYIGPYFENLALYNYKEGNSDFDQRGVRDNVKLGGQISLLQTNVFNMTLVIQYTNWIGDGVEHYKDGCAVGLCMRSYPKNPFVLEWKFGTHFFSNDYQIFESNLQIGVMEKDYEIFAGWKELNFSRPEKGIDLKTCSGVTFGVRKYLAL